MPEKGSQDQTSPTIQDIAKGLALTKLERAPDSQDRDEEHQLRLDELRERVRFAEDTRAMRKLYAGRVFFYLCVYTLISFGLILLAGFGAIDLPELVLVTVSGSTAVSAIGLVMQVVRGLFGSSSD